MPIELYQQCAAIAIFTVLLIAAFFDCKSNSIPLFLFPTLMAWVVPLAVMSGHPQIKDSLVGMLIGTGAFLILAIFFKGGGADILMMGVLGWCLGARGTVILILVSSSIYIIVATVIVFYSKFIKKEKGVLRKQYPFAPFVLAGYISCLLFGWLF